jgi:hypothetical protein
VTDFWYWTPSTLTDSVSGSWTIVPPNIGNNLVPPPVSSPSYAFDADSDVLYLWGGRYDLFNWASLQEAATYMWKYDFQFRRFIRFHLFIPSSHSILRLYSQEQQQSYVVENSDDFISSHLRRMVHLNVLILAFLWRFLNHHMSTVPGNSTVHCICTVAPRLWTVLSLPVCTLWILWRHRPCAGFNSLVGRWTPTPRGPKLTVSKKWTIELSKVLLDPVKAISSMF